MMKHSEMEKIREATVAGIFYPDDPAELKLELKRLLSPSNMSRQSKESLDKADQSSDPLRAILAPHAGYTYSGDLCAVAWKAASSRDIERVVIIAPVHRPEEALVYLPESDVFDTPLGRIEVDSKSVGEMLDCGTIFCRNDIPHFEEHGIEVQLPFMRYFFPKASLVPILVGGDSAPQEGAISHQEEKLIKSLAKALGIVFSEKLDSTLFVLSSDIASGPEEDPVKEAANEALECIEKENTEALIKVTRPGVLRSCAMTAIAAYLKSGLQCKGRTILLDRHDSSPKRESAREHFVEYAALAFF